MLYYKGLYILEENDIVYHFLMTTDKYSYIHPSTIENFDRNDKDYVAFKRKLIIENLLNPRTDWESKLPVEQLKKLNQLRMVEKKAGVQHVENFEEKELIYYKGNKGEVTRKYKEKGQIFYSIKVGKEQFTKIHGNDLSKRTDVRKHLETIPENPEYKNLKTEKLLAELRSVRNACFSYYSSDKEDLIYWQLKKELATRPHIKRKGKKERV